jgi:NAD(P)-dependent dehydrogenase (short-subunit alcohol dehydrogenase family)
MAEAHGKLAGKVALVTGAGSMGEGFGTGKAMSVLFAREGARLVLVDIDAGRAAETQRIIEEEGGEATVVLGDLSDPTVPARLVADAVAAYGRLDILVNNAAYANSIGLLEMDDATLHQMIAINLTAPLLLCKAAIPARIESGDGGSIVNISSVASIAAGVVRVAPCTRRRSQPAASMTVDLAGAFGRDGIRVNTIAPGMITTPHRSHMRRGGVRPRTRTSSRRRRVWASGRLVGHRRAASSGRARRPVHHRRAAAGRRRRGLHAATECPPTGGASFRASSRVASSPRDLLRAEDLRCRGARGSVPRGAHRRR